MDLKIAKRITKAIVEIDHPLLDFRSKEAKQNVKWVYEYLKPYVTKKSCRMLDIGCGTGKQSFAMEGLGAKVAGIDCSEEAIKYANRTKKKISSNCEFIVGDYKKMPFRSNSFDVAIFPKNIIECSYREIEKLSIEVKRILKKDGTFVVTMEDGLKKILQNKKIDFLKIYKVSTAEFVDKITLPNKKEYYYPTYLWTIALAKYIFSRKISLVEEKRMDSKYHLLVFKKKH